MSEPSFTRGDKVEHPEFGKGVVEMTGPTTSGIGAGEAKVHFWRDGIWRRVKLADLTAISPTLYRIVDEFPYLEREDEYSGLTLEEAAIRMDDLTSVSEGVIISDVEEDGADVLPWVWEDDETNRTVTMMLEVAPEAGDMSTSDGLGR